MRSFLLLAILCSFIHCAQPTQSDAVTEGDSSEKHRPQFHFSPPSGWMNDPNGLVYFDGEYHMFYQHYPDSTVWGPMHWGHAVSKDLVHWEHLPIALYPDSLGYIFSGSAVADKDNTSGFGKDGQIPLVAIFTHHDAKAKEAGRTDIETQSIAYSLDKGRTWTKYAGNPVVKNPGEKNYRDPKVFWHEASGHWIMPIASTDHLDFYRSPDLKQWTKTGEFGKGHGSHGGTWECPDLLPINTNNGTQWLLIQNMDRGAVNGGSGTQYFIGQFDGKTFINANPPETTLWLDYGSDNYAGVTWFDSPGEYPVFIGWMSQWFDYAQKVPTKTWRSAMTLPRQISLSETPDGMRLIQRPFPYLHDLRLDTITIESLELNETKEVRNDASPLQEVSFVFDLTSSGAERMGFILKNNKGEELIVGYDQIREHIYIDRTKAGQADFSERFARVDIAPYKAGGALRMHALIDVASIELFVDNGIIVMTEIFFPTETYTTTSLFSEKGNAKLVMGEIYPLKPIWH